MWATGSCGTQIPELPSQNNNDYTPPEKKSKKSSENEALHQALECCKNQEIGIEEASAIYGVPKRTLRAKLKNDNFSAIDEKYKVFVLPMYPLQAETDLVEHLQDLITAQITFSSIEVRRLGYELVCYKYKVSNLPQEKHCLLGQRWYKKFMAKYPHLDQEHPVLKVHQDKSVSFYNALEGFVSKYAIDGSRIFSVDGIELKFRASNGDDMKIFHKRKIIYTDAKAICCTSPIGVFVPPVFIKPCETFSKLFRDDELLSYNGEPNSHLGIVCDRLNVICNTKNVPTSEDLAEIQKQIKVHLNKKLQPMSEESEEELREKLHEHFTQLRNKGMLKYESTLNKVTHELFYEWFLGFVSFVKPDSKVLLLLSDQNYVKYIKTLELAKSNNVMFLVLPPHSEHKIHPLDGLAMSLNRNLSTCALRWLGKNSDFKSEEVPLHALFKKAYSDTINPTIAKNGFVYSGIWPVNRNIFKSSELGGESVLLQEDNRSCLKNTGAENFQVGSNLQKLCRVCMKEKMYMKPLFESDPQSTPNYHARKISEILNRAISPDDGLPTSICQYCLVQLKDTIKIRSTAVESHKKQVKLREALSRLYFEEDESGIKSLLSLFQCDVNVSNQTRMINRMLSKNFDISSLCRICVAEKPLMTSIFFKPQGGVYCPDVSTKIMEVSQCQVHINDGLSSSICPFCRASINQASEFIQRLLSSDKRFREIVAQIKSNC